VQQLSTLVVSTADIHGAFLQHTLCCAAHAHAGDDHVPSCWHLNSFNKPIFYNGQRDWSHGGCNCLSAPGTCLCARCFPRCTYAKTQSRFNHLVHQGIPHPSHGEFCTGNCCSYGILLFLSSSQILKFTHLKRCSLNLTGVFFAGCPCFLSMGGHKNICHWYHIDSSCCSDLSLLIHRIPRPNTKILYYVDDGIAGVIIVSDSEWFRSHNGS
jgi:hypothetical protein